jgi:4-hydroxy-3-methylbut-2-enyl diphosphate reductase
MARRAAKEHREGGGVKSLGPLIHNPQVVHDLQAAGVTPVQSLDGLYGEPLLIRTHGVAPAVIEQAELQNLQVIDATCPYVARAQQAAAQLVDDGFRVVIVGEAGHAEVIGIRARAGADALVVATPDDLPAPPALVGERIGVVVQTTQTPAALDAVVRVLSGRAAELRVVNTICSATTKRQQAAAETADAVEVMLVLGGRNSGNTQRLFAICAAINPHTHLIESAAEIDERWFEDADSCGVSAGASTPEEQIQGVIRRLEEIGERKAQAAIKAIEDNRDASESE